MHNLFFLNLGGHSPFLWDHWYQCFWLLVISPVCFKATMGSLIPTWWRYMLYTLYGIHLRATPPDLLSASLAAKLFSSTYLWAGIGGTQNRVYCAAPAWYSETRQILYPLSHVGLWCIIFHRQIFINSICVLSLHCLKFKWGGNTLLILITWSLDGKLGQVLFSASLL